MRGPTPAVRNQELSWISVHILLRDGLRKDFALHLCNLGIAEERWELGVKCEDRTRKSSGPRAMPPAKGKRARDEGDAEAPVATKRARRREVEGPVARSSKRGRENDEEDTERPPIRRRTDNPMGTELSDSDDRAGERTEDDGRTENDGRTEDDGRGSPSPGEAPTLSDGVGQGGGLRSGIYLKKRRQQQLAQQAAVAEMIRRRAGFLEE
ncbi:hypothetical protein C8R47DRAFT_1083691 [Mycena vitilis]|nr:hypothetical protein C8R47DRAFT_1083691 [Mycena vitilis]